MRTRQHVQEVPIASRPGSANNLPGSRAAKPGWKHPVMAMAKIIAWQFAVEQAGGEDTLVATTDWASLGITGPLILARVRRLLPEFDTVCDRQYPHWTSADKARQLQNRLWYMYRKRKNGKVLKGFTVEHPQSSERLRPLVALGIRIHDQGKPYRFGAT